MDIGYGGDGWDQYVNPSEFKSEAFASGCWVNVFGGCRTAVDDWIQPSVIEQFSEILDVYSRIFGSSVRTQYSGGIVSDENLVKENEGEIIESKIPVGTPDLKIKYALEAPYRSIIIDERFSEF